MKKNLLFASVVAVLFSSCSTDNTQDVVGVEAKNGAISATVAYQQDETRTELVNRKVVWSKGDALGVFGAPETPQVQFGLASGEGTADATFSGNNNYLTEEASVYAYYPYTKNTSLTSDKTLQLEIANVQTYKAENTFDAAQAPGVAFIEKLASKDDIKLSFKGVASYVVFPVMGSGTIKSLELAINNQKLSGVGNVDFDDYPTAEEVAAAELKNQDAYADLALILDESESKNNVNVFFGALELDPRTPKNIMFVVPSGIKVSDEITLTATFADDSKQTLTKKALTSEVVLGRNAVQPINYNGGATWTFGLEGKYLIDNTVSKYGLDGDDVAALDFITYAYFTQPEATIGSEYYPSAADYVTLATALGYEASVDEIWAKAAKVQALVLADEIDFEPFNVESVYATLGIMETETALKDVIKVYKNALDWYKHNDYAIESLSFNAVRGYDAKNPAVLKNLTVLGNGVTAKATLENLKFENSIVIADNNDKANSVHAGFIAPTAGTAIVNNVVIGAGNILNAMSKPEGYIGGLFGVYNAGEKFDVKVDELPYIALENGVTWGMVTDETGNNPAVNGGNTGQVFGYVYAGGDNVKIDLDAYKVTALNVEDAMPAVFTVVSNKKVIDFTATETLGAAPANVVAFNGTTATDKASIVINDVSYWNGDVSTDNIGGNDYFTAEELAGIWASESTTKSFTLTDNIDMQNGEVALRNVSNMTYTVATTAIPNTRPLKFNTYEIKNVVGNATGGYATLFGQTAHISNVKLSNVVINAREKTGAFGGVTLSIAGVAKSGSATNVTIDGLTLNIPKTADISSVTEIAGVFGVAAPSNIDNVSVSNLKVVDNIWDGKTETRMENIRTGAIAGTLNVETTEEPLTLNITKVSNINMAKFAKNQSTAGANGVNYTMDKNYGGNYAYGTICVVNAQFLDGYKLYAKVLQDAKSVDTTDGNNGGVARMAAGVVFSLDGKLNVVNDGTACAYNFETNVAINAGNTKWGFNPVK